MPTPGEHKTVQARILAYAQEIGWRFVPREEAEKRQGFPPHPGPHPSPPRGRGDEERGEGEYCSRPDRRRALSLFDSKYAQRTDLILVVVAEPLALADLNLPESHWA